jgi:hypothetical protein
MAMFSVHKKNQLEARKNQSEGLRKLHFGQAHEHQRTHEVLAAGRDVRDTKAPLAHSRFSDWVTSRVATGEIQPPPRKEPTVYDHQFRDRVKLAEVGERAFGVYYEKEKERIDRNVSDYQNSFLQREAWFKNQCQPGKVEADAPTRKLTGTVPSSRHFTDAERINASIDDLGAGNFDMHAGHGWKKRGIPKFRPELPKTFAGETVKPFDFDHKDYVWEPPTKPNSVLEPYVDKAATGKPTGDDSPKQHKGDSKTRFDFDSKADGRTRLNFAIPTPAPKPEPTARIKRYNNSLKGVTCFLPHSMTAGFDGDGEVQRQAKSIVAGI